MQIDKWEIHTHTIDAVLEYLYDQPYGEVSDLIRNIESDWTEFEMTLLRNEHAEEVSEYATRLDSIDLPPITTKRKYTKRTTERKK